MPTSTTSAPTATPPGSSGDGGPVIRGIRTRLNVADLAELLQDAYGLKEVSVTLHQARQRDNFAVQAGSASYVFLLAHHTETQAEIEAELELIHGLSTYTNHAPAGVPTSAGDSLLPVLTPDGIRYGCLQPRLVGQMLDASPQLSDVRAFATALTRIHITGRQIQPERPTFEINNAIDTLLTNWRSLVPERAPVATALAKAMTTLRPLLADEPEEEPRMLCHGNLRANRILIEPDGNVVFLDFASAVIAPALFDVGAFAAECEYQQVRPNIFGAFEDQWGDIEQSKLRAWTAACHILNLRAAHEIPERGRGAFSDATIDRLVTLAFAHVRDLAS